MNNYIIMVYYSYGQVAKHRITAMNYTDAIGIAYKRHNVETCGEVYMSFDNQAWRYMGETEGGK